MVGSYQKILVIKHGALGDIIQGLDSFASLRAAYPHAEIALLTSPAFGGFFENCPWFDKVCFDERAPAWRLDKTLKLRRLFRQGWDAVFDLQCSKRTKRYFSYFFKTQKGDWFGNAPGCSHQIPNFAGVNNRDRMLQTVAMAGIRSLDATWDWITAKSQFVLPETKFCILIPGCSAAKPSKRWSSKHFSDLAQLALQAGITPLLVGTFVDEAAITAVHKNVPSAQNLMGQTNIADLVLLASAADFIVGNDTGPLFLAARSGQPTIMVMGPDTDPAMSAPYGQKATYIQANTIDKTTAELVFKTAQSLKG